MPGATDSLHHPDYGSLELLPVCDASFRKESERARLNARESSAVSFGMKELKVGDIVIIRKDGEFGYSCASKVDRISKSLITAGGYRYRRSDWLEVCGGMTRIDLPDLTEKVGILTGQTSWFHGGGWLRLEPDQLQNISWLAIEGHLPDFD